MRRILADSARSMGAARKIKVKPDICLLDVPNIDCTVAPAAANDNAVAPIIALREKACLEEIAETHKETLEKPTEEIEKLLENIQNLQSSASEPVLTGKEEDVEVGLSYFGKRFLNPLLGRWISADPLAVHAPGEADLNLYAYVSGAVLKNVDPLGLEGEEVVVSDQVAATMAAEMDDNIGVVEHSSGDTSYNFPEDRITAEAERTPTIGDQRVEQMENSMIDASVELAEGPLRLGEAVLPGLVGEGFGMLAEGVAGVKSGPPDDPALKQTYDEHKFGFGLSLTIGSTVLGGMADDLARSAGLRGGHSGKISSHLGNDLEWSTLSLGDKGRYEVGQLTLNDDAFRTINLEGFGGDSVQQVVTRGAKMLEDVRGTVQNMSFGRLRINMRSGATPADRAVGKTVAGSLKAGAVVDAAATTN